MSSSSTTPQPLQEGVSDESHIVSEGSLSANQETPNQPDPPPKSDTETLPPPQLIPDPEDNNNNNNNNSAAEEEEEDDDEGEEIDERPEQETPPISSGMPPHIDPPITEPHVAVPDVTPTSLSNDPNTRRGVNKRKKGKSKGKPNIKKRQAIEEKLQTLMVKLNPIPFIPHKILDFGKHEKLLKKLGLWDYVHINFDRNIRADLIAQLIATYGVKSRASYVKDTRIQVNRADLARAFKLPFKKEKGNAGSVEVDSDWETLSDESIGFVVEFVSDWVLLHEDMWLMPNEVMEWLKVIKEGHPEKVDWAGLFWFMVEKELKQGDKLRDCYYASHLQHLIKYQRGEEFLRDEPVVKLNADAKDEEDEINEVDGVMEGPSTVLTLGQDGETDEDMKDAEMMEVEKCEDIDKDGGEEEQVEWLLHGKNDMGEHFMQPCSIAGNAGDFGNSEDRKDEEEEIDEEEDEETGNHFHGFPNGDAEGDGFTGNLLQAMEINQMGFTSQDQLRNASSMNEGSDMQHIASTPFFNNTGKREIGHDSHIPHHLVNDSNKRLRLNNSFDHKPVDFGTCIDQIQQMTERARLFYEEKEKNLVQSNMNQDILLSELQKRDAVIEHLHKARFEETKTKDGEIFRLERELYLMGGVLDGYRRTIKEVTKAFAEYKERAQLPEEPTYKDVGFGGLMLTAAEIEKLHRKQEEEYKMNCIVLEHKMKDAEQEFADKFDGFFEKVNLLGKRLTGLEADGKELVELYAKRKFPQTEEKCPDVAEPLPIIPPEEKVPEAAECLLIPQTNEEMPEIAEPLPNE